MRWTVAESRPRLPGAGQETRPAASVVPSNRVSQRGTAPRPLTVPSTRTVAPATGAAVASEVTAKTTVRVSSNAASARSVTCSRM